jgi:hypothetical protein
MNCIEFERLLEERVENREPLDSSPPPAHVATCGACRGLWDRQILLEEALVAWKADPIEADLTDRILEQVRASAVLIPAPASAQPTLAAAAPPAAAIWSLDRARLALAGLAAMFVAAVLWSGRFESSAGNVGPMVASDSPPQESEATLPQIDILMASAQTAYRELAHETAEMAHLPVIPSTPVELPRTGAPIPQPLTWFGGVGQELAPLPTEVGSALNFLWDTLPGGEEPAT